MEPSVHVVAAPLPRRLTSLGLQAARRSEGTTRHLVPRAPAFVHNAVEVGSGKTKLFDTVPTTVIGTTAPLLNAEVLRDETEL